MMWRTLCEGEALRISRASEPDPSDGIIPTASAQPVAPELPTELPLPLHDRL